MRRPSLSVLTPPPSSPSRWRLLSTRPASDFSSPPLAGTAEQLGGFGTLVVLTMAALGGVMVPRFAMPETMQRLGLLTPHTWALTAYQDVLVRGHGLVQVLPAVGALLVFAAAFFAVALARFRWE